MCHIAAAIIASCVAVIGIQMVPLPNGTLTLDRESGKLTVAIDRGTTTFRDLSIVRGAAYPAVLSKPLASNILITEVYYGDVYRLDLETGELEIVTQMYRDEQDVDSGLFRAEFSTYAERTILAYDNGVICFDSSAAPIWRIDTLHYDWYFREIFDGKVYFDTPDGEAVFDASDGTALVVPNEDYGPQGYVGPI